MKSILTTVFVVSFCFVALAEALIPSWYYSSDSQGPEALFSYGILQGKNVERYLRSATCFSNQNHVVTSFEFANLPTNTLAFLAGEHVNCLCIFESELTDISELSNHPELEVLLIADAPLSNLSSLPCLTNLVSLTLTRIHASELPALHNLTKLQSLDIGHLFVPNFSYIPTNSLAHLAMDYEPSREQEYERFYQIHGLSLSGQGWTFTKDAGGSWNCVQVEKWKDMHSTQSRMIDHSEAVDASSP